MAINILKNFCQLERSLSNFLFNKMQPLAGRLFMKRKWTHIKLVVRSFPTGFHTMRLTLTMKTSLWLPTLWICFTFRPKLLSIRKLMVKIYGDFNEKEVKLSNRLSIWKGGFLRGDIYVLLMFITISIYIFLFPQRMNREMNKVN